MEGDGYGMHVGAHHVRGSDGENSSHGVSWGTVGRRVDAHAWQEVPRQKRRERGWGGRVRRGRGGDENFFISSGTGGGEGARGCKRGTRASAFSRASERERARELD